MTVPHIYRQKKLAHLAAVSAIALALAASGCGSSGKSGASSTGGSASGGVIRVGLEDALSGADASYGVPILQGVQTTVAKINASGGLQVGGQREKIKLYVLNDESSATVAHAVTTTLITSDHVNVMIGGIGSDIVSAAVVAAEQYGIPIITSFAYSPSVLPAQRQYAFVDSPTTTEELLPMFPFFKQHHVSSLVIAATNDVIGEGTVSTLTPLAQKEGFSVSSVMFSPTTSSYGPVIADLKSHPGQALFVEAPSPTSYEFRVAQVQYGACNYKYSVYEYGPNLVPDWIDATKSAAVGPMGESVWWPTAKGSPDQWFGNNLGFTAAFQSQNHHAAVWAAAEGADAMDLMGLAIQKAGSLNNNAIASAMGNLTQSTFMGPTKFDSSHFNVGLEAANMLVQQQAPGANGVKIVYPASLAQAPATSGSC